MLPDTLSVGQDKPLRSQVVYHFMLEPMVQWKQHGNKDDFDAEYRKRLAVGPVVNFTVGNQDNKFEQQDKGKETHDFNGGFRNFEGAHQHQQQKHYSNSDSDTHVLNVMPFAKRFCLLPFFSSLP